MLSSQFVMGAGCSLLALAIIEGIALLISMKRNRDLKISDIENRAHIEVERMSDDELRKQLEDELKPR